jgi:hypothetical protein
LTDDGNVEITGRDLRGTGGSSSSTPDRLSLGRFVGAAQQQIGMASAGSPCGSRSQSRLKDLATGSID